MADEVEMTPVAAEPPKADPLAKPVSPRSETLKLSPIERKPASPTASALRPGLKLPPKPGATVNAMRPGLKLPPKPGATVSALKPGLKLPPKPGATVNALRPGLKLPTKPVIRKPGEAAASAPLPKPVTPPPAPAATPAAPAAPSAMEQLKSVTQKLKGVTQQIPQQAILHKTGIIADTAMTEAQKESAKHKTARIALSDAIGVAPVKDEHAPMKTIRIKRPIDIAPSPAAKAAAAAPVAPAPAPAEPATAASSAETSAPAPAPAASPSPAVTMTQRKTLRISRPGGVVRPTGKFGIKKPSEATTIAKTAPAAAAVGATDDVADIPDIPSAATMPHPAPAAAADDGPAWAVTLSTLVQMAACVAVGALAWLLYQNTTIQYF